MTFKGLEKYVRIFFGMSMTVLCLSLDYSSPTRRYLGTYVENNGRAEKIVFVGPSVNLVLSFHESSPSQRQLSAA